MLNPQSSTDLQKDTEDIQFRRFWLNIDMLNEPIGKFSKGSKNVMPIHNDRAERHDFLP